jgi:hypothetical protein
MIVNTLRDFISLMWEVCDSCKNRRVLMKFGPAGRFGHGVGRAILVSMDWNEE